MDIWLILDGEKAGPFPDYEIRRRIQVDELAATTPAWHEGLSVWQPLGDISLFASEFLQPSVTEEIPSPTPPPLPNKVFALRRFWARWFDLYLFAGIWWIAMWAAGRDIRAILFDDPWVRLFLYVPWFVLETWMLHRLGTTPGKWLLGLRVTNDNGTALSLAEATRRSARVLFLGIGFGWDGLALVCQGMALITIKRLGRPLWDFTGGHRVTVAPLRSLRVASFVILFFAAVMLRWIVVGPYIMDVVNQTNPELKEALEQNPLLLRWHLPPRH